jgi:hypothetical protein
MQVVAAYHSGKIISVGTMLAIIEGSGLPPQAWTKG